MLRDTASGQFRPNKMKRTERISNKQCVCVCVHDMCVQKFYNGLFNTACVHKIRIRLREMPKSDNV